MKIIDLKNIKYRLIKRVEKKLKKVTSKYEEELRLKEIERRKNRFSTSDVMIHRITRKSKLKLYKDSLLSINIDEGFEQDELDFLTRTLSKGDTFLDIGANIGLFSILASELVGKTGKVISFEPTPTTYKRLTENIRINKRENIDARQLAISDSSGDIDFHISDNGNDAFNSPAQDKNGRLTSRITVPASTLDIELSKIDKSKITFVKIDVEGWEKYVLRGANQFLTNFSPIVMVEFTDENVANAGYDIKEIHQQMIEYGFEWFEIYAGSLRPHTLKNKYPYENLIAIKSI